MIPIRGKISKSIKTRICVRRDSEDYLLHLRYDKDESKSKIDENEKEPINQDEANQIREAIKRADVVVVCNYGRGTLNQHLIQLIFPLLANKIVILDPGREWEKLKIIDSTILKLNHHEAARIQKRDFSFLRRESLMEEAGDYFGKIKDFSKHVIVTLGKHGSILFERTQEWATKLYWVPPTTAIDLEKNTTHCGDAFLAACAAAISINPKESLSNIAIFATQIAAIQTSKDPGQTLDIKDINKYSNDLSSIINEDIVEVVDKEELEIQKIISEIGQKIVFSKNSFGRFGLKRDGRLWPLIDKLYKEVKNARIGRRRLKKYVYALPASGKTELINAFGLKEIVIKYEDISKDAETALKKAICDNIMVIDEANKGEDGNTSILLSAFDTDEKRTDVIVQGNKISVDKLSLLAFGTQTSTSFKETSIRHELFGSRRCDQLDIPALEKRKEDIPYVTAGLLLREGFNLIHVLALRELMKTKLVNEVENIRKIIVHSKRKNKTTLEWEDINNFYSHRLEKPNMPEMNYYISIRP